MGQTPGDRGADSDFIFYPTNKVVGIIDDPQDVEAALRDLQAAGFTPEEIEVLSGEGGAHRIDVTGEGHGPLARGVRSLQRVLGDYEGAHVRRHEEELQAGHYGIGVTAKDEEARGKAREILKSHRGHFINFYGLWAMEVLEP